LIRSGGRPLLRELWGVRSDGEGDVMPSAGGTYPDLQMSMATPSA